VGIDSGTTDPYELVIGSAGAQTFTSSDPRRLRVHIDVTGINGGGSFTLAYDSAANASNLSTPVVTVPDATLILLLFALLIPVVMSMVMRRSRLRRGLATGLVSVVIVLGMVSGTVMPASAAPDLFYLRDATTNGASPAGEDMNNNLGSSEDTLTFDSLDDEAYWYSDLTYPTGDDNAGIAAGSYSLNMYFDDLPSSAWFDTDWSYRVKITIDHTKVADVANPSTTYADFPVLINLTGLSNILADGADIRFTAADGTTPLPREIEDYSSGTLYAWVKFTLTKDSSDSTDDEIYMYYGNSGASEPAADSTYGSENVWDSDYLMVQHLEETTGPHLDSTSNGNSGANLGSSQDEVGRIDGANVFDGLDDVIRVENSASLDHQDDTLSVEAWVKLNDAWSDGEPEEMTVVWRNGVSFRFETDGKLWFGLNTTDDWTAVQTDKATWNADEWFHLVAVYDGTDFKIYVNGVVDGSSGKTGNIVEIVSGYRISYPDTIDVNRGPLGGTMDEVRISGEGHSADWIETDFNNQNSPSTFIGAGSQETVPPSVEITVSVYHTASDGSDPQEIVTSSSVGIDSSTTDPYELVIGSAGAQTFTSSDPRRLRVHIDVTAVNGGGSFTLAYDSAANASNLSTPVVTVPDPSLILLLVAIFIPQVMILAKRRSNSKRKTNSPIK